MKGLIIILATEYIDSHKDENGNVAVILNCGVKTKNKFITLNLSADFVKYLYLTRTGVHYTSASRSHKTGKKFFGVVEIYSDDFPNQRILHEKIAV
jgi:hypothetical protein